MGHDTEKRKGAKSLYGVTVLLWVSERSTNDPQLAPWIVAGSAEYERVDE